MDAGEWIRAKQTQAAWRAGVAEVDEQIKKNEEARKKDEAMLQNLKQARTG